MIKTIAMVFGVAILVILVYAATRPGDFRVERQILVKAAPEKIFANLNDFKLWAGWSPWEKLDPQMKRTFSPVTAGKGASYGWAGDKAGVGRMEILESTPATALKIQLDFTKPFEAHNTVEFTLKPQGDPALGTTQITWAMYGPMAYLNKLVGVFMSMDAIVGKDFEAGLRDLKAVSEK